MQSRAGVGILAAARKFAVRPGGEENFSREILATSTNISYTFH